MSETPDVVVVGGGILGLATARALLRRRPGLGVLVLEKEDGLARHQTGHNSGVMHSGVYYAPGSLKARLCAAGKEELERFADTHGLVRRMLGKLIVAVDASELPRLDALESRARANGIRGLRRLRGSEIQAVEPHAVGREALHVPGTGVIDYRSVSDALADEVNEYGGEILTGVEVTGIDGRPRITTLAREYVPRVAVTCCGLQSDRLSGGAEARIVPFRGDYYTLGTRSANLVRGLIYPVPDPSFPFLGVHLTRHVDDVVAAGPNAVLSLAREGYRRTSISPRDTWSTLTYPGFWRFARRHARTGAAELWRDVSKRAFVRAVQRYVPTVTVDDFEFGASGIRAQALTRNGRLVDDFLIRTEGRVVHVVNAPSPAATASLAIGDHIAGLAEQALD